MDFSGLKVARVVIQLHSEFQPNRFSRFHVKTQTHTKPSSAFIVRHAKYLYPFVRGNEEVTRRLHQLKTVLFHEGPTGGSTGLTFIFIALPPGLWVAGPVTFSSPQKGASGIWEAPNGLSWRKTDRPAKGVRYPQAINSFRS